MNKYIKKFEKNLIIFNTILVISMIVSSFINNYIYESKYSGLNIGGRWETYYPVTTQIFFVVKIILFILYMYCALSAFLNGILRLCKKNTTEIKKYIIRFVIITITFLIIDIIERYGMFSYWKPTYIS